MTAHLEALLERARRTEAALAIALFALREINEGSAEHHDRLVIARIALEGVRTTSGIALEHALRLGFKAPPATAVGTTNTQGADRG